jgi:hypothetical protein
MDSVSIRYWRKKRSCEDCRSHIPERGDLVLEIPVGDLSQKSARIRKTLHVGIVACDEDYYIVRSSRAAGDQISL